MDLFNEALFRALPSRMASPPEPVRDYAYLEKLAEAYDEAYFGAMEGKDCDFWPRKSGDAPEWNNEQDIRIFAAVKVAAALIYATDSERWGLVERAIRAEAVTYAEYMREKAKA